MADPLKDKAFAVRIMKLAEYLQREHKEFTVSRKVLDSGVSIGLFIEEAARRESGRLSAKVHHRK